MGDATSISWTDATWNPVRGCSRVSTGCTRCYAERVAARFSGPGQPYEGLARHKLTIVNNEERDPDNRSEARWTGEVRLIAERLADPLRWKRPRRIFVNSMSDLFHEKLADEQIDRVFAVMLLAPHHAFQVLTKRAARMRAYFSASDLVYRIIDAAREFRRKWPRLHQIGIVNPAISPPYWIWLGVSVENQAAADERIPELLATPAAVRFLSCEPLLGPVDLRHVQHDNTFEVDALTGDHGVTRPLAGRGPRISWVIAGCESGPGARPCDVAWLRSLRDQCDAADVPFFLKQALKLRAQDAPPDVQHGDVHPVEIGPGSKVKAGGVIELPYLDGEMHAEFPVVP